MEIRDVFRTLKANLKGRRLELVAWEDWVRQFLKDFFPSAGPAPCEVCPPRWVKAALEACGIGS